MTDALQNLLYLPHIFSFQMFLSQFPFLLLVSQQKNDYLSNSFPIVNVLSSISSNGQEFEELGWSTIFLWVNSLCLIGIILTQNDNSRDSSTPQGFQVKTPNPLENFTWVLVGSQLSLLLLKVKV